MNESNVSLLARQAVVVAIPGVAAAAVAYGVASPNGKPVLVLIVALLGLFVGYATSPQTVIAGSLLVFAVSSATDKYAFSLGPTTFYATDLVLMLILFRALLPRARASSKGALRGPPLILFGLWAAVIVIASIRGLSQGVPLDGVIRRETALVYFPLLFFGYSRILREHELSPRLLWRNLAGAIIGLALWMLLMRLVNHPFESVGNTKLGTLLTSGGETVRRDYGFASAFILYPMLGLAAFAGLAFGVTSRGRLLLVTFIGIFATMLTLVRGEIFSLCLGALVVVLLRPRLPSRAARLRTAIQVTLAIAAAALAVIIVSPALGHAIVERSLPGLQPQSPTAESTAEYRVKAFRKGIETASTHPYGLGVLDEQALIERNIPPDYLAHSGSTYLLVDGGWPALVTAVALIVALIVRSFKVQANANWIHPAFVGTLIMLTAYSFGAAGLAGDVWVIGPAALAIALRFVAGTILEPVTRPRSP